MILSIAKCLDRNGFARTTVCLCFGVKYPAAFQPHSWLGWQSSRRVPQIPLIQRTSSRYWHGWNRVWRRNLSEMEKHTKNHTYSRSWDDLYILKLAKTWLILYIIHIIYIIIISQSWNIYKYLLGWFPLLNLIFVLWGRYCPDDIPTKNYHRYCWLRPP